jgi:hypothetical protein
MYLEQVWLQSRFFVSLLEAHPVRVEDLSMGKLRSQERSRNPGLLMCRKSRLA